jgi:hypothetical protein
MPENKQYTNVGDALQACCRRFESAIAHDSVVNWKSVFCGFPFHYFLFPLAPKGVGDGGNIWEHLRTL